MTRLKSRQLENHTTYCIWNAVTHTSAEAAIHNNPQQKLQVYLRSTANSQSLAVSLDSRATLADLNQLLSRVYGINASTYELFYAAARLTMAVEMVDQMARPACASSSGKNLFEYRLMKRFTKSRASARKAPYVSATNGWKAQNGCRAGALAFLLLQRGRLIHEGGCRCGRGCRRRSARGRDDCKINGHSSAAPRGHEQVCGTLWAVRQLLLGSSGYSCHSQQFCHSVTQGGVASGD